ncbi:E3 SUMO-protein ligase ZBED1-like [Drosophila bipectinata]|uniref:E3 SUMO-protein ligase ZBED1-like n=1 Tax=Drosophila bipectinata TaxID=42026 RepID=UPI0038B256CF
MDIKLIKKNYSEIKNGTAKCNLCNKMVKTSGNTTNLTSHVKNKHNEFFLKCQQKKVYTNKIGEYPKISESFRSLETLKGDGHRANEISEALVFMICKDNMPVRCVEKEGLTYLLKKCVPHFKIPGRSKVTTLLENKYTQLVTRIKTVFDQVDHFAFTCDAVTITNSTRSFLTITAHFINEGCLEAICLNSVRMDQISDDNAEEQCVDFMEAHNRSILKGLSLQNSDHSELKLYLSLPQTSWESNPLTFWNAHKVAMPGLYQLARKYLITPGSSVPSERLASAIKCVVCDSRSRMTDNHITQRVFLKSINAKYWH